MGFSKWPHLLLAFEGTNNGPTTYGGGGTKPPANWLWGMPVLRRRLTTVVEYYRIASLSCTVRDFHMLFFKFTPAELSATAFLRDCVNQGWPAASACAIDLALADYLLECGVSPERGSSPRPVSSHCVVESDLGGGSQSTTGRLGVGAHTFSVNLHREVGSNYSGRHAGIPSEDG